MCAICISIIVQLDTSGFSFNPIKCIYRLIYHSEYLVFHILLFYFRLLNGRREFNNSMNREKKTDNCNSTNSTLVYFADCEHKFRSYLEKFTMRAHPIAGKRTRPHGVFFHGSRLFISFQPV